METIHKNRFMFFGIGGLILMAMNQARDERRMKMHVKKIMLKAESSFLADPKENVDGK
jgi:hypothetical protein